MRFTMFVTEETVQFNLHPENDHEKKFLGVLLDYQGPVTLHYGVDISECMGGYLRNFGDRDQVLAVTIKRQPDGRNQTYP